MTDRYNKYFQQKIQGWCIEDALECGPFWAKIRLVSYPTWNIFSSTVASFFTMSLAWISLRA